MEDDRVELENKTITADIANELSQRSRTFVLTLGKCGLVSSEAKLLAQNPLMTGLGAARMNFSLETMSALCSSPSIKQIELANIRWMRKGTFDPLATNTTIHTLRLWNNYLDANFMEKLITNSSVTDLTVSETLTNGQLAETLFHSTTLRRLDLVRTRAEGATMPLEHNTSLNVLLIEEGHLCPEDVPPIARNTTLTFLSLCKNKVGDSGAKLLAFNTTLISLYLNDNLVGDEGALALATNTSIETLDLSGNHIRSYGFKELSRNTTLRDLNVSLNLMPDQQALCVLANNTSITQLSLLGYTRLPMIPFSDNKTLLTVITGNFCFSLENRLKKNRQKVKRFPVFVTLLAHTFASIRYNKRR